MPNLKLRLFVTVAALSIAACASSKSTATDVIQAGQLDIKLPPGWKVTEQGAQRPAVIIGESAAGAPTGTAAGPSHSIDTAASDTIPLAKDDPSTAFFNATGKFSQCLTNNGTKFMGAPDGKDPKSPVNDPSYIKALTTCAAQSNIVQALKDAAAAQDNQTPDQIQKANEGFLVWRDCMIGKGWDISKPKPDSKGRLFSFNQSGASVQINPPPGKDVLSSGDVRDCSLEAQKKTGVGG